MRVETRFTAQGTTSVGGARRSAEGRTFALSTGGEAAAAQAPAAAATLAGLDAVLALQGETESATERRRRSARRGHDLLDGLDRLKAAILSGRVPTGELRAIAGRLSDRAALSGDPRLDGLVADIELRAAVELAKLEVGREA
ncbi:flagellar assembly protein FliX [Methylobacterium nigriterrae]|uniref:flagellar assembly protein FliX n=1 Tax=Methylobacterium nigriterrae TaxID=3127512 RepID=UPI00301418F6